ncbi:hypothetical protein SLEP1_g12643 [Rubroshorea leprosula]|uniref:Uncharacterized protein n=1 Tax=Rubroshorea leprosula TaxID=152421 RepID=A0AAV5IJ84_9ROSI|nr:hypothetical protein SLEP1_g12643 [Rubroshorea leprosula]
MLSCCPLVGGQTLAHVDMFLIELVHSCNPTSGS